MSLSGRHSFSARNDGRVGTETTYRVTMHLRRAPAPKVLGTFHIEKRAKPLLGFSRAWLEER